MFVVALGHLNSNMNGTQTLSAGHERGLCMRRGKGRRAWRNREK